MRFHLFGPWRAAACVVVLGLSGALILGSQAAERGVTSAPGECRPLQGTPVADAMWERGTRLIISGRRVGEGRSDRPFEILDAHLSLAGREGRCVRATAPLGELTRAAGRRKAPLKLTIGRLGEVETVDTVAVERASWAEGLSVLIVHLERERGWGVTERFAVPLLVGDGTFLAGPRVQTGRDAFSPPVFQGTFQLDRSPGGPRPRLVLKRSGMGCFSKLALLAAAESGIDLLEEPSACQAQATP